MAENIERIKDKNLSDINGAGVTPILDPSSPDVIDDMVNGENYENAAEALTKWINQVSGNTDNDYFRRDREVNNDVNIYDCNV